jgi:hypothetical protein
MAASVAIVLGLTTAQQEFTYTRAPRRTSITTAMAMAHGDGGGNGDRRKYAKK